MKIFIARRNKQLKPVKISKNDFLENWESESYYYISLEDAKAMKKKLNMKENWFKGDFIVSFYTIHNCIPYMLSEFEYNEVKKLVKLTNKELDSLF